MRQFIDIGCGDASYFVLQLKYASTQQSYGVVLQTSDDSVIGNLPPKYNCIAAIGALHVFDATQQIEEMPEQNDWLFGYLSYDYKNQLENLTSSLHDGIGLGDLMFFIPRFIIINKQDKWCLGYNDNCDTKQSAMDWLASLPEVQINSDVTSVEFLSRVSPQNYIQNVHRIQHHIVRGDIYEMNYCMEFYQSNTLIQPVRVHEKLIDVSPVPYGAFAHLNSVYLMSASPERYICKREDKVYSQPIKGTIARGSQNEIDLSNRQQLQNSEKERAENIMITDLVRNDLAKIAKRGSVNVDELCGVYGFKQVFQMISTISATLQQGKSWMDVIKATFPMGSMTGAPKLRAMELIEKFEDTKRGLYAGTIGYVEPNGDFDFNVIIRSLIYNAETKYLSYMVGSAITAQSNAIDEYNECILKASAIKQVLGN